MIRCVSRRIIPLTCRSLRNSCRPDAFCAHVPRSSLPVIASFSTDSDVVLYKRTSSLTLFRTGIGFSSFHTAYWIWYVTDFIPLVNASPMEQLHVDPAIGMAGLAFSTAIQVVFFVYPIRLVSKLAYRPATQQLAIYTHRIPWVRPSARPHLAPLGKVVLDPTSNDTATILNVCDGDLTRFRGHLAIGAPKQWPPYVLDIQEDSNINSDLLLQALLFPEQLQRLEAKQTKATGKKQDSKLRKITKQRRR